MPTASKAFQAFVHVVKPNPVTLKLSEDSNTRLRIPNQPTQIFALLVCWLGFACLLKALESLHFEKVRV